MDFFLAYQKTSTLWQLEAGILAHFRLGSRITEYLMSNKFGLVFFLHQRLSFCPLKIHFIFLLHQSGFQNEDLVLKWQTKPANFYIIFIT